MPKDNNFTLHMMCQILDYKTEMTLSAFRTLVQLEQAHLHIMYTQIDRYHGLCFPTVLLVPKVDCD